MYFTTVSTLLRTPLHVRIRQPEESAQPGKAVLSLMIVSIHGMSNKLSYYRYYCPSPSERLPCPVGYFCPVGVSKRIACPFNSATCASTRASNPNKPALFMLLFLLVFGIFFIYRWGLYLPHITYLFVC